MLLTIKHPVIRKPLSLAAAGPRPCYRAAFSSAKMCFASFCLPSPSLGTEQKEARSQGLIRKFFIEYPDVAVFILLIKQILNYQIAQGVKHIK